MIRIKKIFPFLLLLILFLYTTAPIFAEDYFLYDAEGQKILFMGGKGTEFLEKLEMNKNPDYLMPTNDPDKFLAIYLPEITEGKRGLFGSKKEADIEKAGELVLFNVATGRTEDLIRLGFSPFIYDYTEDYKHFVITYRTSRTDDSPFEVLYYNIPEQKSQKLTLPKWTKVVNQIVISPELQQIMLLLDNKKRELTTRESKSSFGAFGKISGNPGLVSLSFNPLEIKKELALESCPIQMYSITPERAVLLCQNYLNITDARDRSGDYIGSGTIRIINPKDNSIIQEYKTHSANIYRHWYNEDKVLIINYYATDTGLRKDIREIYMKIDATSAILNEFTNPTGNFEYQADKNCLYIITEENLTVIDYKTGDVIPCLTGSNSSNNGYYEFMRIPDTDVAVIYKFEKSAVKFFDLNANRVIKKVTCGRGLFKALNSMYQGFLGRSTGTETTISVSPDKSKYFIFNKLSDDITVYGQDYEKQAFIAFKNDTCLGMYFIQKPTLQTVLIGKKKIYKLDYEKNALIPIHNFSNGIEAAYLFSDEIRSIVLSDNEIVVLDSRNLEVKNNFNMFIEKKEPDMKLNIGDQRYYFIPNL